MALQRRGVGLPTDGFSSVFTVVFWLAFFAAGGYGVFWCIGALKKKADTEVESNAPKASAQAKKGNTGYGEIVNPRRGGGGDAPAFLERKAKPELDRAAAEINILILAKEAARLRGDTGTQMDHAKALQGARQRFQLAAEGENVIPELLEGNDEILGLDDADFTKLRAEDSARRITQAISRIPAASFLRVKVRRGNPRDVILYFGAATGTGNVIAQRGYVKISNSLAIEVQKNILTLPEGQLTEVDKKNIERILGAGECTEDEYAMLMGRLRGAAVDTERASARGESFTRQIRSLQAFLPKAPVPEAVLLKDGRRFTGKLLQDTPAAVAIRTVVGDITVAKDDVERLITADDLRAEFQSKFGAGEKYEDALLQLLVWTQEMNMPVHRELVAYTILTKKPSEPFARNAAGYVQMDGQWTLKGSIAAGAPIPERKAETKDEIRRELESMGFILRGTRWFSKVKWETGIENLWKPSTVKSNQNGTAVVDWHEADTPRYRLDDKPKKLGAPDLKFIAPTGTQGLANILVEAPGEIVECQVRACGAMLDERPGNARIECFLTAENGKAEILYDITSKADFNWHDVTLQTRGKQKFTVTARMLTVQDKYHTYARWLPSNKDTTQVFWVKGVVLKAAAEFDRVWANAR